MKLNKQLNEVLQSFEVKSCKYCKTPPEFITHEAISILRCHKCSHSARGYILEFCMKSDQIIKDSVSKLVRNWNERN